MFRVFLVCALTIIHMCNGKSDENPVIRSIPGVKRHPKLNLQELDPEYWRNLAKEDIKAAIRDEPIIKRAKNVILMLADGFSITTITAARILKGQKMGKTGEESVLSFEKFSHVGLSKTYNVDHQIPDSAGTGIAYLTGVKGNYATIGVSARVRRGDCKASLKPENQCPSILAHAQNEGKSTGLVTNARVSHASPANAYAHSPERRWENDAGVPKKAKDEGCKDIAAQLVDDVGRSLKVILGGGRRDMRPTSYSDEENPKSKGKRTDDRNLIQEWLNHKNKSGDRTNYVWNRKQLLNKYKTSDNLIGLFEPSHLKYTLDNKDRDDPSLAEMAEAAIHILKKNENGYALFIEAARIDTAHHDNYATLALHEALEFDKTVEKVRSLIDPEDTLVIVTADHSHSLIMNSYATRGNPILGLADYTDDDQIPAPNGTSDVDGKPYTTLLYGNGPGYKAPRQDLTGVDTAAAYFQIPAGIPNQWVSHDGSDVPIYATGAMSHLIHTTHEQSYIFHALKYAACLGEHQNAPHCSNSARRTRYSDTWRNLVLLFLASFSLKRVL